MSETFWDRTDRIRRDHNVSWKEADRVARAEIRMEAAKSEGPNAKHAKFQPGELVMFEPGVTGGGYKAKILEVHWDDLFKEWRYHFKITGRGGYYYPTGWSDWVGQSCLSKRS